jgi:hypothetical protein
MDGNIPLDVQPAVGGTSRFLDHSLLVPGPSTAS